MLNLQREKEEWRGGNGRRMQKEEVKRVLRRHNDIRHHGTSPSVQNIIEGQPFYRSAAAMSIFFMYRMQMRTNETCIVMTEWEFETLQFESFIWSCQRSNMRIIAGGTAAQDVRADDSTKIRTESIDENLTG